MATSNHNRRALGRISVLGKAVLYGSLALLSISCAPRTRTTEPERSFPSSPGDTAEYRIQASVYHQKFEGRTTASGEPYAPQQLTAAHRTYPFGTKLKLRNPRNQRIVTVRVNDRGPFIEARQLDISNAAASALGVDGVATLEVIEVDSPS